MPYISVQTNQALEESRRNNFLKKLSARMAEALGKPEQYVVVAIEDAHPMLFGGTHEPAAFVELRSVRLPEDKPLPLTQDICDFLSAELGVDPQRIFVQFTSSPGELWGWNNQVF